MPNLTILNISVIDAYLKGPATLITGVLQMRLLHEQYQIISIGKYTFLEWKMFKEVNSHIDSLPKISILRKSSKIMNFKGFLLVHPLKILFVIKNG